MTRNGDSSPLFAAKVSPPRLRSPSVRADQLARVAQAGQAKLLLVRAPAGYGKTTLIAAAAESLGWQHLWYRLDSLDADPLAFLCSLTHALRRRWPSLGEVLLERAAGSGPAPSAAELVVLLVRELESAANEGLFIILDDYESLRSAAAFNDVISALLDDLPETVHLLVLSRVRPAFPTAKLSLDGDLIEVSHRGLRFDRDQVSAVVERQSGARPTGAVVERLLLLTEGWAAGVLLAGKAAAWTDPREMDDLLLGQDLEREVFPYLAEQVYASQSRQTREFLKATCCLETMTASLAASITGSQDAGRLLEELERREVFTFTDATGGVYRYHPLFRRFLQARLILEDGEEAYAATQRRSADGLARHELFCPAIDLYLGIHQPGPPLALLRARGYDVLDECSEALSSRWAGALREEVADAGGWPSLLEGHGQLLAGRMEKAREQLTAALALMSADAEGRYLAHRELAHCSFYAGSGDGVDHLREALALARGPREEAECYQLLAFFLSAACRWRELDDALTAFDGLGRRVSAKLSAKMAGLESESAFRRGDVRRALKAGERALPGVRSHNPGQSTSGFLHLLANVNFFAGRYERAARLLREAQELCDLYRLEKRGAELEVTRGALLAQEGRLDESLAVFEEALAAAPLESDLPLQTEVHMRRGTALRRSGSLSMAAQAYETAICTVAGSNAVDDKLSTELDLAFTRALLGADTESQIRRLMGLAGQAQLLFQLAKGEFFLGVLAVRRGAGASLELASACGDLLRLGHIDFLGQESVAYPEAARSLLQAEASDDDALRELLGAIAPQAGGAALLDSLAALGDRAGLLVVESARPHLPAQQAGQLLRALRRHPSKRVRERARRVLLSCTGGNAGRLFPELTPREEEVLAVIAEGGSNEEIAKRLFLTVATVKTHVHRILRKTATHGRLAAAILYRQRSAGSADRSADPNAEAPDEGAVAGPERR